MKIPSKYLEFAVEQLSSLPGIGKRTALRMALNLLNRENDQIVDFSSSILDLKTKPPIVSNAEIFLIQKFALFVIIHQEKRFGMCC